MAGKIYDPAKPYSDNNGAFTKLNKDLVESLFSTDGPYSTAEFVPNWLQKHELGYELVRINNDGEVVHRFGMFITIHNRIKEDTEPVTKDRGKAVAHWQLKVHIPGDDYTMRMSYTGSYTYIVAYPDGYVAINPMKIAPSAMSRSSFTFENKEGVFPFLPLVALAFFMEIEEIGNPIFEWLVENGEGWRDALGM